MKETSSDAVYSISDDEVSTPVCAIKQTTPSETDPECVEKIISESKKKDGRRTFFRKKPSEKWLEKRRREFAARCTVRLVTAGDVKRVRVKNCVNFYANHIVGIIK